MEISSLIFILVRIIRYTVFLLRGSEAAGQGKIRLTSITQMKLTEYFSVQFIVIHVHVGTMYMYMYTCSASTNYHTFSNTNKFTLI